MPGLAEDPREINSILHDQWRNNNTLLDAQFHILHYLGFDPFGDIDFNDDQALLDLFSAPVTNLEKALARAIDHIGENPSARSIPIDSWDEIRSVLTELLHSRAIGHAPLPLRLRELAVKIRAQVAAMKNVQPTPRLNKERIKDVLTAASEMERLVCIFDLRRAIEMTKITNDRIFELLELNRSAGLGDTGPIDFDDIVSDVAASYRDQATRRGIELAIKEYSNGARVNTSRAELIKALGNLLDNAIKYTGKLPEGSIHKNTWIELRIFRGVNTVSVRIESWGIPITQEERNGGFVFKQGYRGWFARKTSIKGSGTGLADVLRFARKFGGALEFDSTPVRKDSNVPRYATTTVTLSLPPIK
jgi:signal transduction histidine kinase